MTKVVADSSTELPSFTANDAAVITGAASLVKVTVPTDVLLWLLSARVLSPCTENVGVESLPSSRKRTWLAASCALVNDVTAFQVAPSKEIGSAQGLTPETWQVRLVASASMMPKFAADSSTELPSFTANDAAVITGAASLVKVTVPTNVLLWCLPYSTLFRSTENVGVESLPSSRKRTWLAASCALVNDVTVFQVAPSKEIGRASCRERV